MTNGRLIVGCVRLQKAGAELINIFKFSNKIFTTTSRKKLNDPGTSNKTYWSIMKTFINAKKTILSYHFRSVNVFKG